jgi:hypothetical protein
MYLEKILEREDKSKVKIECDLQIERHEVRWRFEVYTCAPRKRTWINTHSTDDHKWRILDRLEREEYKHNKQLSVCTLEEMRNVAAELLSQITIP